MAILILGLVVFLGVHSVRIVADDWRAATIARIGTGAWKGVYSVLSLAGFVMIVWGYGLARHDPVPLWSPPVATRHVASLLTLVSFVLVAAAYVPRNGIRAALGHPMLLGVKLWAFAHLLANGTLADVLLFGAFLAWAVLDYRAARRRDAAAATPRASGTRVGTATAVVVGAVAWGAFAFWLHAAWIGVAPFAR